MGHGEILMDDRLGGKMHDIQAENMFVSKDVKVRTSSHGRK